MMKKSVPAGGMTKKLLNLGAIIAIILGIGTAMDATWATSSWLLLVLMVIGLIAGFYSFAEKDAHHFLIGVVGLILALAVSSIATLDKIVPKLGTFIQATLGNFVIVLGIAAIVVSVKAIYGLQK